MNLPYFLCTPCIPSTSIVARSVKQASCHVHAPKWVITRTVALPSSRIQTNPQHRVTAPTPNPSIMLFRTERLLARRHLARRYSRHLSDANDESSLFARPSPIPSIDFPFDLPFPTFLNL